MNDTEIRRRLRAAIGEWTYPTNLTSSAVARLKHPVEARHRSRAVAVVAAVVAVVVAATIMLGGFALHRRLNVPVKPPQIQVPGRAPCPNYSQLDPYRPEVKMSSPATGWAAGGLKTTDGGARWQRMSPSQLFAGMPAPAVSNGLYPPGFKDFDLDATHEWEFRTFTALSTCIDHGVVFATSDGGRTWKESQPITFGLPPGWAGIPMDLQFLDSEHGWLLIEVGPWLSNTPFGGPGMEPHEALLYATADGGSTWVLMSTIHSADFGVTPSSQCPFPEGDVTFVAADVVWMDLYCQTDVPAMLVSNDGGTRWTVQRLAMPDPPPPCLCSAQMVHVFDATDFVIRVEGGSSPQRMLATSDGGRSWHYVTEPPSSPWTEDFVDPKHWWAVTPQPGYQKGSVALDWLYRTDDGGQTWTIVATSLPIGVEVEELFFIDALHAIVVQPQNASNGVPSGDGQEVWRSDDGGHTWRKVADKLQPQ